METQRGPVTSLPYGLDVCLMVMAAWAAVEYAQQGRSGSSFFVWLPQSGDAEAVSSALPSASSATFQELRKWVDMTEAQYAVLHAKREMLSGRYASALR